MKRSTSGIAMALCAALLAATASADDDHRGYRHRDGQGYAHYDHAKVVHVQPIVGIRRVPGWRRICIDEHGRHTRCRMIREYHERKHVGGYRVTYRYRGREYVTRLDHHPGRKIKVKVTVTPEHG